jgi:hypothetical protein
MNMNLYRFFVALFFIINANLLIAQETVSFRTDRDTYIAGEFVWINATCLKSGTSVLSEISTVIYIEVLDSKNVPVKQLKLKTEEGSISTQFELPETLPTGNYTVRGYTKWMRNYKPELYFTKIIAVVNPFAIKSFPKSATVYRTDTAVFYPECGKIIRGVNNKITVQTLNKFGESKSIEGEIISPAGAVIQKVKTSATGFAAFNFTPEESGSYRFRFKGEEKAVTVSMPSISESGINLQLVSNGNKLIFGLAGATTGGGDDTNGVLHIVTSHGEFAGSYPVSLKDKETVSVDAETLPAGYLSALLINKKGEILASRYFAAQANSDAELQVSTDKKNYRTRVPVTVKISKSKELKDVSVSVVKACLLNYKTQIGKTNRPDNIPFQALEQMAGNAVSVNDLLLCFNPFGEVLADAPKISFLPEMKGEIISGTILDIDTHQPVTNKVFILSFVSKYPTIGFSRTDSLGRFKFVANRVGQQEIVIQPFSRETTGLGYKVNLDFEYSSEYADLNIQPLCIATENLNEINQSIINMQVNALYSPFNSYPVIEKQEPNPVCFYGEPEFSVQIDKFIELPTMEEIIAEIVPHTFVTRKKGVVHIIISEGESLNPKESDSFCMVDGVPIRDHNKILKIDYREVEKIDVVNLDYFIQENRLGNILNVTTKTGDMSAFAFDTRLFRQAHNCYSPTFLFNSPDYSVDSIRTSRIPDFRNLLFWNPDVAFNENSESEITFYTSDEATKYVVVVEGINSDGIIERRQISFDVTEE